MSRGHGEVQRAVLFELRRAAKRGSNRARSATEIAKVQGLNIESTRRAMRKLAAEGVIGINRTSEVLATFEPGTNGHMMYGAEKMIQWRVDLGTGDGRPLYGWLV